MSSSGPEVLKGRLSRSGGAGLERGGAKPHGELSEHPCGGGEGGPAGAREGEAGAEDAWRVAIALGYVRVKVKLTRQVRD